MIKTNGTYNEEEIICPPDPERIVEGLRDTGYNFNTAIADIVDNSIAAYATRVDIRVEMDPSLRLHVYIADNGVGMDEIGLKNAMTYGSKVRADLGSLGKFGLGLKTASTAFCRAFALVSRASGTSKVNKVQWDLDHIAEQHEWKLLKPSITPDEMAMFSATAGAGSGTLVIWEKVDRLLKHYSSKGTAQNALKKKISELAFHLGMVYQRFLDIEDERAANVEITLNGERIVPWDPFVKGEPFRELLAEDEVDVEMPDDNEDSKFMMRAYMIPRRDDFSTTKARDLAQVSNDMQGFYIYRENRLIHYGDWLGMFTKEPHLSLLRVEFSFDHFLDQAFNVDIKKSRILPADEIIEYIKKSFIQPPRRAAEERYRTGVSKSVETKSNEQDAHAASNRNIDEKARSVEESTTTVTKNDEVMLENQNGSFTHRITVLAKTKPGQVRVIPTGSLVNGQLWEPCIAEGKHAVQINQSHPYYQKIYYPVLEQNVMVTHAIRYRK